MEQNSQPTAAPVASGDTKSIWSTMVGVFTSPGEAFQSFKISPSIILPLVIFLVIAAVTGVLTAKHGAILQYEMLKSSPTMPPQALEQMKQAIDNPSYVSGALVGPIFIVIFIVLEALLAMFLGNVIFAGQAKYKSIWGVGILSGLITVVGGLIRVPLVYAKGTLLVSLGLAALMPGKDFSSMLYGFLYFADIFGIWALIVSGIGYSIIFGLPRGKGYTIAVINFLIFTLLAVGLQIMGLSLAGVDVSLM